MTRDYTQFFKGKVLIVDDTPDNLRLLSNTLTEQGYDVQCALTGQLALIGAKANPPDVILLDIRMPQMDGYMVCEQLKASEVTRDIPVIFLSALDETFDKLKAFKVGGVDYITKPFQVEEVIARVENQLALQAAKAEVLQLNAQLEQRVKERTEALRQLNLELQASEERFRTMANVAPVLIWMTGADGRCTFLNQRWLDFTGHTLQQAAATWSENIHPDDQAHYRQTYQSAAAARQPFTIEYRLKRVDQTYRWVLDTGIPLFQQQEFVGYIGSCIDIHDRKQAEEQLLYNALHDALTDLPNRSLLMERLELAIKRAKRLENCIFAVLFLDLDRFKVVNDSLGHLVGDQLLMTIAQRLEGSLRTTDLIARLGGDEFVILLEDIEGIHEAIRIAKRVLTDLQPPFLLEGGEEVFITASIGVVLGSTDYNQGSELLRDADIAMYQAKARGKARYEIFNPEMHLEALKQLHLESDLRKAIEHQQFVLYYQPIVCLMTDAVIGFEALIRWQHPLRGLISPAEFIPIAEETRLILPIGAWVLRAACRQVKIWQTQFPNYPQLKVSVNLSAQQLREVDLIEQIDQILAETGLHGSSLALEITESMLIENVEQVITLLSQLRLRSIQVSIDDFGTGYSSLSYLHRFPIHALKIDHSFISRLGKEDTRDMVEIIITLTHQLQLVAIAEGVETEQQLRKLKSLGCNLAQGYFLARPLTVESATDLLAQHP